MALPNIPKPASGFSTTPAPTWTTVERSTSRPCAKTGQIKHASVWAATGLTATTLRIASPYRLAKTWGWTRHDQNRQVRSSTNGHPYPQR